ncbi:hypothetical protein HMPREF3038_00901 [Akkermansia sp. KLE1797]|nr:hypothetical protein HMPREF3038_00901 [Akkermansia sp. KLE1797]
MAVGFRGASPGRLDSSSSVPLRERRIFCGLPVFRSACPGGMGRCQGV